MTKKPQVLFICYGNSARSQMAEAFLRNYAGNHFNVQSAGVEPESINPYTVRVMVELGYDMSGHRSKNLREFMGYTHSRYVITLCSDADASCPRGLWSSGEKLYGPFDDPAAFEGSDEEELAFFRKVRDKIEAKVLAWLEEIEVVPQSYG